MQAPFRLMSFNFGLSLVRQPECRGPTSPLVAFRWTSNYPDNTFLIRANLKCDQHWVYSDPHTPAQNLVYDPAILGPDGR